MAPRVQRCALDAGRLRACGELRGPALDLAILGGMPKPRAPLPKALAGRPFAVGEALELEVTRHRLRAADLTSPIWGVRRATQPDSVDELAQALAVVLPRPYAFSHLTAARLWRLPLPTEWSLEEPVHVIRPTNTPQLRRARLVGHRGLEGRETQQLRGHEVTTPAVTWVDLASLPALSVEALVIAGDAFATRDPALLAAMVEAAQQASWHPGVRAARAAAALLRAGSESPMETRARLAFAQGGLPEPELNAAVHDEAGQFVARGDFVWRAARVIVEYEGDQHRTSRRQWQHDIARTRLLEALGWKVIRITARDVTDQRLRRELMAHLARLLG